MIAVLAARLLRAAEIELLPTRFFAGSRGAHSERTGSVAKMILSATQPIVRVCRVD
jgi:hypothetical protein